MLHFWWLTRLRAERDDQSLQVASDFAFRRFRQIREQVALQEQRVGVATNTPT
jgi:hypothetical protein